MSLAALMAADGVGARERLEMGRRSRWGRPDGCQRLGCKGMAGNGWRKKPLGMSELGCADGCGRCGCKGVAGNGLVPGGGWG